MKETNKKTVAIKVSKYVAIIMVACLPGSFVLFLGYFLMKFAKKHKPKEDIDDKMCQV